MKKLIASIIGIALLLLVGCAQKYYDKSNLNQIALGQTKEKILSLFPGHGGAPGMEIRAAQLSNKGKRIEIGEVLLTDGSSPTVLYWFLFEDGLLVQWGRPEDWQKAAPRHDINYNPSPSVIILQNNH